MHHPSGGKIGFAIAEIHENTSNHAEIAGFELLTMDDMWREVKRIAGERVTFKHDPSGGSVEWVYEGKTEVKKQVCVYTPETLMTIYDIDTKGNPVD